MVDAAVLVSANAEWAVVRSLYPRKCNKTSPLGEYFFIDVALPDRTFRRILVFHGGWGKIKAAASTQYVIDHWNPPLIINLGTCGGIDDIAKRFTIVLATKTVIYDIVERMGNPEEAIAEYSTEIDLGWLGGRDPEDVQRGVLISADQDLDPAAITTLRSKYGAIAADWESGAIAYTAQRYGKRILIIRGVTDLVGPRGGEAYGKISVFWCNTETVMKRIFADLPFWLKRVRMA
jgi:adenosylhomocysteine nucleosidase